MKYNSSPLWVSGSNEQGGRINYFVKICEDNDNEYTDSVNQEYLNFINEIKLLTVENEYICRVYIYNCTNLTPTKSGTENGFIWVKRYETDEEFKDESTFNILSGEVNRVFSLNVLWPYTFDIRIQVYGISGILQTNSLIGETVIDLEKRLFNKTYLDKISEYMNLNIVLRNSGIFQ
jgi:hypothetical protein